MAKKNKMKPRELREAQKKARQLKAAEINNNAVPAIAAMPAAEAAAPAAEKKKSSVKAAGMKSILVSENKMYITSFGKGNSAVLEYEVDNNDYNKTPLSKPCLLEKVMFTSSTSQSSILLLSFDES